MHLIYKISFYETALNSCVKGQRLQLMPFFLYLLQHLVFGFKQFEEQIESQLCCGKETIGVIFLFSV